MSSTNSNHNTIGVGGQGDEVMGGSMGSIAYTEQEEHYDPGRIGAIHRHRSVSDVSGTHSNQRQHSQHFPGENIVINAESMKDGNVLEEGKNAIQSFVSQVMDKKPVGLMPASADNNTGQPSAASTPAKPATLEEHIKYSHIDNKRRFHNLPPKESKHPNITPEPIFSRHLITKLRSWRSGYARILSLHHTYFTTLDPETMEITNLWYYKQVTHYMAIPKEEDCISIDVMENPNYNAVTKLKLKCLPKNRNAVLTSFAQSMYKCDSRIAPGQHRQNRHPTFVQCQRLTRHNTRIPSALLCAPHAMLELDPKTGKVVRTYFYTNIQAVCFLNDDFNGVVFYFNETNCDSGNGYDENARGWECKVWFVAAMSMGIGGGQGGRGSGRSELLTVLKNKFELFCIPLTVRESIGIDNVIRVKAGRCLKSVVGGGMGSFPVVKLSARRQDPDGSNKMCLVLTRNGYLLEEEIRKVMNPFASCRSLYDITSIIRPPPCDSLNGDIFTIEFKGGMQRTYKSTNRDAVIVSVLDAAINMCRNYNVTVTDVPRDTYRIHAYIVKGSEEDGAISATAAAQSLFQQESVELQCLRLLHQVSSITNTVLQYVCRVDRNMTIQAMIHECNPAIEACRYFNANVTICAICSLPNDKKLVGGSIELLFGIASIVLSFYRRGRSGNSQTACQNEPLFGALLSVFQTLYRLMMTEAGYSSLARNNLVVNVLSGIWDIEDSFTLYWSIKCLSVLLLPRPFAEERDEQAEFDLKSILLKPSLIGSLVGCMMGVTQDEGMYQSEGKSELVRMVASNIIESLMCSHRNTTPPKQFAKFVEEFASQPTVFLSLLQTPTSLILENATLILRILTANSPKTADAVRESALTSGILLKHFYHAVFSSSEGQRILSAFLCSLWMAGPRSPEKNLLKRMVPCGFFQFLSMPVLSSEEEEQLGSLERAKEDSTGNNSRHRVPVGAGTNCDRFRLRIKIVESSIASKNIEEKENFRIFFHVLTEDHSLPDLIWNESTRKDLQLTLDHELDTIREEIEARHGISNFAWNHEQFSVVYPSLEKEVQAGGVYMRHWLEASDSFIANFDNPSGFFKELFRHFLINVERDILVTNMCIQCLERLYSINSGKIGRLDKIELITMLQYMMTTNEIEIRHRLLSLVAVLTGVNGEDKGDNNCCRQNLELLLNMKSIYALCEMAAECHVDSRLEKGMPSEIPQQWYTAAPGKIPPLAKTVHGPFTINCLKKLWIEGKLGKKSLVAVAQYTSNEAEGIEAGGKSDTWLRLETVWQLRRTFLDSKSSNAVFTSTEASMLSLKILTKLVQLHGSTDSRGIPFFPIPIAKRLICESSKNSSLSKTRGNKLASSFHNDSLSVICQCLLSDNAEIVESSANLIRLLMFHNEKACSKLYLTGSFFFAFARENSNWLNIAKFLYETHLKQDLSNVGKAATDKGALPTEDLSFLDNMLPMGMLKILVNHGPDKFSEIVAGNHDNPEVIWTSGMRQHLVSLVQQHLGDFPTRLRENITLQYDYSPIPAVSYDELENELFCHNYYLNNLCDEGRFRDWPISEPFSLFVACIQKWRDLSIQVEKKKSKFANEAKATKNIFSDSNIDGLSATQYHLYPTWLLMKTQLLICKRYANDINKFKYPVYEILLSCLRLPGKDKLHSTLTCFGRATFIRIGVELLFHSCLVSPLNAEELIHEGGVVTLVKLLDCYITVLVSSQNKVSHKSALFALQMETLIYVVHTLSGIAYYKSGRKALEAIPNDLCFYQNWRRCIDLKNIGDKIYGCNLLKRYALEGLLSIFKSEKHQTSFGGIGIMWNLVECMLGYDPNLELTSLETETCEEGISQVELNYFGGLATRGLGMICGVMKDEFASPPNEVLFDALKCVLTKPIAKMLRHSNSEDILRTLNLCVETPLRLWDMDMRNELVTFISIMVSKELDIKTLSGHIESANSFQYSNLSDEANIGGVYVRIFNKMDVDDAVTQIPDLPDFVRSLFHFLGRSILNDKTCTGTIDKLFLSSFSEDSDRDAAFNPDKERVWYPCNDDRFVMCVKTLHRLVKTDGLTDTIICEPHAVGVLMSLTALPYQNEASSVSAEMMLQLAPKQAFADAIVACGRLPWLLSSVEKKHNINNVESHSNRLFSILESLASSTSVATYLVNSSGWLELLSMIAGYEGFAKTKVSRDGSARTLARLLFDPQVSTTTASLLQRFIPSPLVLILKSYGAETFLQTFDKDTETPQLLWDESMRKELLNSVSAVVEKIFYSDGQRIVQGIEFDLPPSFAVHYRKLQKEICIGNVYIIQYMKDPSFELMDPCGFLEALLLRWSQELESMTNGFVSSSSSDNVSNLVSEEGDIIELVTSAIMSICEFHPHLCEKLGMWGYNKILINFMYKTKTMDLLGSPLLSTIRLLHAFSSELSNVEDLITFVDSNGKNGVVDGIIKAIDGTPLHPETGYAVEALKKVFQTALGDVEQGQSNSKIACENPIDMTAYAMAPSPAPGIEPVSKMKKKAQVDHPLAMIFDPTPAPAQSPAKMTRAVRPNERQNARRTAKPRRSSNLTTSSNPGKQTRHPQLRNTFKSDQAIGRAVSNQVVPAETSHSTLVRNIIQPHRVPMSSVPTVTSFLPNSTSAVFQSSQLAQEGNFINSHNPKFSPMQSHAVAAQPYPTGLVDVQTMTNNVHAVMPSQTHSMSTSGPLPPETTKGHFSTPSGPLLPASTFMQPLQATTTITQHPVQPQKVQNNSLFAVTGEATNSTTTVNQQSIQTQQYNNPPYTITGEATISTMAINQQKIEAEEQSNPPFAITGGAIIHDVSDLNPRLIAEERMKTVPGAPNSAKGRNILLDSALKGGLPEFLITTVLENPELTTVKDIDGVKTHAVDLLQLLRKDPGYGMTFELVLDDIPAWKKHKPQ